MFHSQEEFLVCSTTAQLPCLRGSEHQLAAVSLLSSPLLKTTWNTHWLLKVSPHDCINMGVASEFEGDRSLLKSYEEHFSGQIMVDTRLKPAGGDGSSEVQPAHLQSFVSTSLTTLTSRDSHLKIVMQVWFSVITERMWLLSHCQSGYYSWGAIQQHWAHKLQSAAQPFASLCPEPSWIFKTQVERVVVHRFQLKKHLLT